MTEEASRGERIEYGQPSDLPGVTVLSVGNCARRWRHYHETYTICTGLAIDRPAAWAYRNRLHYQPANGVSLMEPGEIHANTAITDPASFRVLLIDPQVMLRTADAVGAATQPHIKIPQVQDGPIYRALRALHASLEEPANPLERQSKFLGCMRLVLEHCAEAPCRPGRDLRHQWAVSRAKAYIYERLTERITLDELTKAAHASSRFDLVRAFSTQTGLPPHAYQIHLRITRSRKMLTACIPPAEVATALGFADQSHFTRHFRRIVGVTPSAYTRATVTRHKHPHRSVTQFEST